MEAVIDKIKKLMSLSKGTDFEEESSAALAKAYELMAKHNIAMCDVEAKGNISSDEEKYVLDYIKKFGKEPPEILGVNEILESFFFVRLLKKRERISAFNYHYHYVIFGTKENIEVGKYLFTTIILQYRVLWETHKKNNLDKYVEVMKSVKSRNFIQNSYYKGLTAGIVERLEKQNTDVKISTALVVLNNDLDKELGKIAVINYKKEKKSNTNYDDYMNGFFAYQDGLTDSENIKIQKDINNDRKKEIQ